MTDDIKHDDIKYIVLVVEDDPILRMMAVDMVHEAGFAAEEASDADQAVLILERKTDIRIVFTDLDMPGSTDGIKLAAAIRSRWPPIEIILTSGRYQPGEITLPARATFFPKPYDLDEVQAELHRLVA